MNDGENVGSATGCNDERAVARFLFAKRDAADDTQHDGAISIQLLSISTAAAWSMTGLKDLALRPAA